MRSVRRLLGQAQQSAHLEERPVLPVLPEWWSAPVRREAVRYEPGEAECRVQHLRGVAPEARFESTARLQAGCPAAVLACLLAGAVYPRQCLPAARPGQRLMAAATAWRPQAVAAAVCPRECLPAARPGPCLMPAATAWPPRAAVAAVAAEGPARWEGLAAPAAPEAGRRDRRPAAGTPGRRPSRHCRGRRRRSRRKRRVAGGT